MRSMESLCCDREDEFYDAREELSSSASDWDSDRSDDRKSSVVSDRLRYDVWTEKFGTVLERRRKFLKWMGLTTNSGAESGSDSDSDSESIATKSTSEIELDAERAAESTGAVLRNSSSTESTSSSFSSVIMESVESGDFDRTVQTHSGPSSHRFIIDPIQRAKRTWLRKLGINNGDSSPDDEDETAKNRVPVYPYKKRTKELSSLHAEQEIRAHEGWISTMKFSHDGRYLASAGEDGVVRVWEVNERESERAKLAGNDEFFAVDRSARKLDPLDSSLEKSSKSFKRSNSACVVYPRKAFNILDKPLHEFQGHVGEVFDLSWSSKGYLLSSSIDKTVRLWQVGCDDCLRVFLHNNYVTCVDFNPVDDNHFISGSIDGKVRIWEIQRCRVIDYIDVREIVTAVSYRPDGKGGIVGSMIGTCLFYNIVDDRLQLDAQICLPGKKKSSGRRITGFKFTPDDPGKVMITSADSLVRIVSGNNVIFKFKGLKNAASHASASFTPDGKHIVSATEDSSVYIWNYNSAQERTSSSSSSTTFSRKKKSIWASESFPSRNASIAIPWCGPKECEATPILVPEQQGHRRSGLVSSSSPEWFSLAGFLDSLPRVAATWPEEKLAGNPSSPSTTRSSSSSSSKFKFLRSALQTMSSGSPHMWGLVIVTAGWDGRIRTFLNHGLPLRL